MADQDKSTETETETETEYNEPVTVRKLIELLKDEDQDAPVVIAISYPPDADDPPLEPGKEPEPVIYPIDSIDNGFQDEDGNILVAICCELNEDDLNDEEEPTDDNKQS
jgi:hypothetical protein